MEVIVCHRATERSTLSCSRFAYLMKAAGIYWAMNNVTYDTNDMLLFLMDSHDLMREWPTSETFYDIWTNSISQVFGNPVISVGKLTIRHWHWVSNIRNITKLNSHEKNSGIIIVSEWLRKPKPWTKTLYDSEIIITNIMCILYSLRNYRANPNRQTCHTYNKIPKWYCFMSYEYNYAVTNAHTWNEFCARWQYPAFTRYWANSTT